MFWLETAQAGRVLAIAYPLCTNLFDDTLELAHLLPYDQEHGIDATCGYRFYLYEESCRPLFELCQYEDHTWRVKLNKGALVNALLTYYPDYGAQDDRNGSDVSEQHRLKFTPREPARTSTSFLLNKESASTCLRAVNIYRPCRPA